VVGARVCLHGKGEPALDGCVVVENDASVLKLVTGEVDAVLVVGARLDEFDLACLPVLVEEAGGRVTITEDVVLATNGVLHDALLDMTHGADRL
jgi:hypothetical protein